MNSDTKKRFIDSGWTIGNTQEFLDLSDEEMKLVEFRIALGRMLRERRESIGYTQTRFSKEIGTSQSRLAKMEAGDASVTVDLLLKSIFHFASKEDVCSYISAK